MHIHYLQHVDFEGPGYIEQWARDKVLYISGTRLYNNQQLPDLEEIDLLIVMGGPMGVYDEQQYPWLVREKAYIKHAIELGKRVLGICLIYPIGLYQSLRVRAAPTRDSFTRTR